MKQGQTFHPVTCDCSFCKAGDTRFPIPCQATFKEHCQYPECDCDRPVNSNLDPIQNNCTYGYVLPDRCRYMKHKGCACGAYPPIKDSAEQMKLREQLKEVEAKLNGGYVGGMTEYWNRRRSHLLKEIQEIQMRDWNL